MQHDEGALVQSHPFLGQLGHKLTKLPPALAEQKQILDQVRGASKYSRQHPMTKPDVPFYRSFFVCTGLKFVRLLSRKLKTLISA